MARGDPDFHCRECGESMYGTDDLDVVAAVEALDMMLTADEIARLENTYRPHPVLGH